MANVLHADLWRLNVMLDTPSASGIDPILDWTRPGNAKHGRIGAGMSLNAGIFSFPETGVWMIQFIPENQMRTYIIGNTYQWPYKIRTTTDDSTWADDSMTASAHNSLTGSWDYSSLLAQTFLNITNIALQKVRFSAPPTGTAATQPYSKTTGGSGDAAITTVMFIRWGPSV